MRRAPVPIDEVARSRGSRGRGLAAPYAIEALTSVAGTLMSIGVVFFMKDRFGWRMSQNFWLFAGQGLVYVPASLSAGRMARRLGPRGSLGTSYLLLAAISAAAALAGSAGAVAGLLLAYTFVIGLSWPVMEGLVASGGPPGGMARRVSTYNMIWPAAGALAIALEGTIIRYWPAGVFLVPAAVHLASAGLLVFVTGRAGLDGAHAAADARSHPTPEPELVRARTLALWLSRVALPATYTVIYGLMPIMAFLPAVQRLSTQAQTVVGSVWLMTRWIAFAALAAGTWWHTRPRALLWAAVAMLVAFFGMTLPPTRGASPAIDLASTIAWEAVLGVALGMIYAGSLYFGMVLSEGSTEHGGYHEALIGLGWAIGPAAGALALRTRPGEVWVGVAAVGAVIAASVVLVVVTAVVMGQRDRADSR